MALISATEHGQAQELLQRMVKMIGERVVGQQQLQVSLLSTLLAGGHLLLESVPGLAKTTAAQTLADSISGTFHRIQCTPDLMPNDIVGTQIFNYATGAFSTQLGPVHANLVLLDEINRSSAKTQSAMLEAMQERQTSIGGEVFALPDPFMVVATQNPIEEEGTYILPEAQMDRFLMKEVLTYPLPGEEEEILERLVGGQLAAPISSEPVTLDEVRFLQELTKRVYIAPELRAYIVRVINVTRGQDATLAPELRGQIRLGASPRGAIALVQAGQALALLAGREYVVPDDIKALRYNTLRHRIIRSYDAIAAGVPVESLIDSAFNAVRTP